MKLSEIPISIGAFGTMPIELKKKGKEDLEIRTQLGIIQTKLLLRSARILKRALETRGGLL